jgi:hypothetical protein
MLFTTHLTNTQIVLSKLMSRLFVVGLLILSALPVFSLITLFGGVDPRAVAMNTAATLLALVFVGSVSIYFSVTTRSPLGALVRTYGWLLIGLVVAPLLVVASMVTLVRGPTARYYGQWFEVIAAHLHPVVVFMMGISPEVYDDLTRFLGVSWFYPLTYIFPSLVSVFLLWRASRLLRQEPLTFWQRFRMLGTPLRWLTRARRKVLPATNGVPLRGPARVTRPVPQRRPRREVGNLFWQRARQVRVFDREGYVSWIQWAGWLAAALFFVILLFASNRQLLSNQDGALLFISPIFIGLLILIVLVAASSIVGDRRRGFFELVLITPVTTREIVDGTLLAIWHHLRPAVVLLVVLSAVFMFAGASHWLGVIVGLISSLLFATLLACVGLGCSLAARTYIGALVPTFIYGVIIGLGLFFLVGFLEEASGPALWILAIGLLLLGGLGVYTRTNPALVGLFFLGSYLAIMSLATCWTWSPHTRNEEFPVACVMPLYMSLRPLEGPPNSWFVGLFPILAVYGFYWAGLVINILFVRWWLITNFDRLVGREVRRGKPRQQLATAFATAPVKQP